MRSGQGNLRTRGDSFIFDFTFENQRYRIAFPLSPKKKSNWIAAKNKLASIQHDIALGVFDFAAHFPGHPRSLKLKKSRDILISECLSVWLRYKAKHCEVSTLRGYRSAIDYYLKPVFGKILLADLTANDLRKWMHTLTISNQRINNVLIPLRGVYADAYADELIDRNPFDRLRQLPRVSAQVEPFSIAEIQSILDACEGQIRNIFEFAFWTGLRTSELIALRWCDVDLVRGTAMIHRVRTKFGEKMSTKTQSGMRTLELLLPALLVLKRQLDFSGKHHSVFLNPRTDAPWTHDGPLRKTAWVKAMKASGVKYRKPYATRHTFASLMLSAGINPLWVAKQMGHKDWGMIRKVYGRWIQGADESIEIKVNNLLARICHTSS